MSRKGVINRLSLGEMTLGDLFETSPKKKENGEPESNTETNG